MASQEGALQEEAQVVAKLIHNGTVIAETTDRIIEQLQGLDEKVKELNHRASSDNDISGVLHIAKTVPIFLNKIKEKQLGINPLLNELAQTLELRQRGILDQMKSVICTDINQHTTSRLSQLEDSINSVKEMISTTGNQPDANEVAKSVVERVGLIPNAQAIAGALAPHVAGFPDAEAIATAIRPLILTREDVVDVEVSHRWKTLYSEEQKKNQQLEEKLKALEEQGGKAKKAPLGILSTLQESRYDSQRATRGQRRTYTERQTGPDVNEPLSDEHADEPPVKRSALGQLGQLAGALTSRKKLNLTMIPVPDALSAPIPDIPVFNAPTVNPIEYALQVSSTDPNIHNILSPALLNRLKVNDPGIFKSQLEANAKANQRGINEKCLFNQLGNLGPSRHDLNDHRFACDGCTTNHDKFLEAQAGKTTSRAGDRACAFCRPSDPHNIYLLPFKAEWEEQRRNAASLPGTGQLSDDPGQGSSVQHAGLSVNESGVADESGDIHMG